MQLTKDELIEMIVQEVLAALSAKQEEPSKAQPTGPSALVIGDAAVIPEPLKAGLSLHGIEEYGKCGDIGRYDKVIITELSLTELGDIALCRDSRPAQCAVVSALLRCKEVILLESGLPVPQPYGPANRAMLDLIRHYIRTIQGFGVKIVSGDSGKPAPAVTGADAGRADPAVPDGCDLPGVITESVAKGLLSACGGTLRLAPHIIITPSARDVFRNAKIKIKHDETKGMKR